MEDESKVCWNCEKEFIPYEIEEGGEILIEDQFCCGACANEWRSDNRYEFL